MYPWDQLDPQTDTTLRMIHESALRGHTVAISSPNNLTIRNSLASAFCDVIVRKDPVPKNIPQFHRKANFRRVQLPLAGFDVIMMRANPPLDAVALNFLDSVREDTLIINDINGLRLANNKIYATSFHDEEHCFVPATHVSKNKDYLERVFRESESDKMILKPFNGYGGQGVIVIEKKAIHNFRSLLEFYIGDTRSGGNYVILQDYISGAEKGDVRILLLNGEPIGAMRRVPAADDCRSNIHAGGTVVKHTLTKQEKKLCEFVGPKLVRDGLYFVGLDVVEGQLLEINVLSPGGITRINTLNRVRLQAQVLDFIEKSVKAKENLLVRKNELRKAIEDADA